MNAAPPGPPLDLLADPLLYGVAAVLVFLLGMLFGSFFNVAIYRVPIGLSVGRPARSFCFRCGSPVEARDNVPVLSWLLLRGRCRSCGVPFSWRYAGVELLTGAIFCAVFLATIPLGGELRIALLWYWAFAGLLIVGTFTDFDHWIIPDSVTVGGALAGIPAALLIGLVDREGILTQAGPFPAVRHVPGSDPVFYFDAIISGVARGSDAAPLWWDAPANALLGILIGPAILFAVGELGRLLFRKDAMGFGDVKLFALIGVTLGPVNTLLVLFMASILGTISGLGGIVASWFAERRPPPLAEGRAHAPRETDALAEDDPSRLLARLVERDAERKPGKNLHHLPFGPWIALAGLLLLLFHEQIRGGLAGFVLP
ncbi:MAG: prepilin peptidase [Candidatus Sumerlaeia bacterium]|nr:prepilin peptidase [Candidatus Sumerlaeia bacterium]